MDEVGGAVDGVDDEGRRRCQPRRCGCGRRLFAEEAVSGVRFCAEVFANRVKNGFSRVVGKGGFERGGDGVFDGFVGLGDQIGGCGRG